MAKGSTGTEKSNPKEDYDGFIKAYASWMTAKDSAEGIASGNASKRHSARSYAMKHADANIPFYKGITKRPDECADLIKNESAVDQILDHAVAFHGALASGRYSIDRDDILGECSDKGLAAIVLEMMPAVEMKDHKDCEEAAQNHALYQNLKTKLSENNEGVIDPKKMNHSAVLKAIEPHIIEVTARFIDENKYLKGNDDLLKKSIDAAFFAAASSSAACFNIAKSMLVTCAAEFNRCMPKDTDKANYARAILKTLDDEIAMELVFQAYRVAEQIKKKGKKK